MRQVADIFYAADGDESGGLGRSELEVALARILNVDVVPAEDLEKAWGFMMAGVGGKELGSSVGSAVL